MKYFVIHSENERHGDHIISMLGLNRPECIILPATMNSLGDQYRGFNPDSPQYMHINEYRGTYDLKRCDGDWRIKYEYDKPIAENMGRKAIRRLLEAHKRAWDNHSRQ